MVKSFNEIRRIVGNFEDMTLLDAKKLFPSAFDSRVGDVDKSLSVLKSRMNEFNQTGLDLSKVQAQRAALTAHQKDLETEYNK